jgi:acyl-CoA reductase-like NAD-dependent aldehyde dehydrogenase
MQDFKTLIDGKLVDAESGKTYTAINPANEEEIVRVPLSDKADVDKAVVSIFSAIIPICLKIPLSN